MTAGRKRDEYGRAFYADREVPPVTERFAHWRGRLTVGGPPSDSTSTTMHQQRQHDGTYRDTCVEGWVASGEWWLHCGRCRPYHPEGAAQP